MIKLEDTPSLMTTTEIMDATFRTTIAGNYRYEDVDTFIGRVASNVTWYRHLLDQYREELEEYKTKLADYQTVDNQTQITETLATRVADKVISRLSEVI